MRRIPGAFCSWKISIKRLNSLWKSGLRIKEARKVLERKGTPHKPTLLSPARHYPDQETMTEHAKWWGSPKRIRRIREENKFPVKYQIF
jgi:hypothetical protein